MGIELTFLLKTFSIKRNHSVCHTQIFYSNYGLGRERALYYANGISQRLVSIGSSKAMEVPVTFCFYQLKLNLTKVDKDTKEFKGQGEADLKGTIFTLYNNKKENIYKRKWGMSYEINEKGLNVKYLLKKVMVTNN